jgi:hypothetical protein
MNLKSKIGKNYADAVDYERLKESVKAKKKALKSNKIVKK